MGTTYGQAAERAGDDVVYHKLTDSLFAATYGRGIWSWN